MQVLINTTLLDVLKISDDGETLYATAKDDPKIQYKIPLQSKVNLNFYFFRQEIPKLITESIKIEAPMNTLSWPISYDHYNFHGKDFMFFGDRHEIKSPCENTMLCAQIDKNGVQINKDSKCWTFDYFLIDLFKRSMYKKRYLDFFFEIPYNISYLYNMEQTLGHTESYLDKILYSPQIRKCFGYDKKGCDFYPYVRAHYTDLRQNIGKNNKQMIPDPIFLMLTFRTNLNLLNERIFKLFSIRKNFFQEYLNIIFTSDNYPVDVYKFLQTLGIDSDLNIKAIKVFIAQYKFKLHPIRKQYLKLKQQNIKVGISNLADVVREFINDELNIISNTDIMKSHPLSESSLSTFNFNITKQNAAIMDSYLLLRLFRNFDNPSNLKIIYTGFAHTIRYCKFFENKLKCKLLSSIDLTVSKMKNVTDDNNVQFDLEYYLGSQTKQCLKGINISHILHQPPILENVLTTKINNNVYQLSREYIYGLIVGFTELNKNDKFNITIDMGNTYVSIDYENMFYVLKIGSDNSKYVLKLGTQDYYFNKADFISGFNDAYKLNKLKAPNNLQIYQVRENDMDVFIPTEFDLPASKIIPF